MTGPSLIMPSEIMQFVGNRQIHKLVIGRVKFDSIYPHAIPVKSAQFWNVPIGLVGFLKGLVKACHATNMCQMISVNGPTL